MFSIKSILKTHSEYEIKRLRATVRKINDYEDEVKKMSKEDIRRRTRDFKKMVKDGTSLDEILPEAFAMVRESADRVLGMRHYDEQLLAGIILHQGRIAEMKTGQGKTLAETLPVYLNALTGKGVHVVTVNDYLAERDANLMGQIYKYMGLTVGVILQPMESRERRKAYNCDITYVTNNELGFDYLRDNMVYKPENQVLRGLEYALIDEIDSILIDEARTPLIIAGKSSISTELYAACNTVANMLERGEDQVERSKIDILAGIPEEETGDYIVDEKKKTIFLTEEGVKKVEELFEIENLADMSNLVISHGVEMALRAKELMKKDKDYLISGREIKIIDEFTGRVMGNRQYSDGLHQAIEAKEGLEIHTENKTLSSITLQSFFNKYKKKCGMTGTGITEEKEFREIYGMDVIAIPTHQPVIRIDHEDKVYKTTEEKIEAIVKEVKITHALGQPVLVGTTSVAMSETLSRIFTKENIPHSVLNAKNHEYEARIIAKAGNYNTVTIATNMAGRGTDIKLDAKAKKAGGLKVIGTERSESRRIDNQLIGRSGRQGDPGESIFFISLEDRLFQYVPERVLSIFKKVKTEYGEEIKHNLLTSMVENAQKNIEGSHFAARKSLLQFSRIDDRQRDIIYKQREIILHGCYNDLKREMMKMMEEELDNQLHEAFREPETYKETLIYSLKETFPFLLKFINLIPNNEEKAKRYLYELIKEIYAETRNLFDYLLDFVDVEKAVILNTVDKEWANELDELDLLKQGINLQSYGNKDPAVAYEDQAYQLMNHMNQEIRNRILRNITDYQHIKSKAEKCRRIVETEEE